MRGKNEIQRTFRSTSVISLTDYTRITGYMYGMLSLQIEGMGTRSVATLCVSIFLFYLSLTNVTNYTAGAEQ